MASRMEKYHKNEPKRNSRSNRNKNLYNTMYSFEKYSNIEGVAPIGKSNQIDITKVKELIDSREKYQREKSQRKYTVDDISDLPIVRKRYEEDINSNHDVMDVLKNAKEQKETDNKERSLNSTNYDILKKLNLKPKMTPDSNNKEDLKDIIETISNTSMLNKIDDNDLAMDMFKELSSDDTKVGDIKDIKEFTDKNEKTMDDSFFTSGVNLKKADFIGATEKKSHKVRNFFIVIFILGIIAAAVVLLLYNFNIL